jgi:hypothetical protein
MLPTLPISRNHKPKTVISFFIVLGVVLLLFGLAVRAVLAQVQNLDDIAKQGLTITAIPARMGDDDTLQGEPGKTIQTSVKVMNNTKLPLTINTIAEDFIIGEDGKTPQPVDAQAGSRWSLSKWMKIVNPTNLVPANSTATVTILISIPANALPGGRYAMIMHSPAADGVGLGETGDAAKRGAQAGINQRVGTLVYLRIPGPVKEEAHIRNFKVPGLSEFGPIPMQFSIESLSDIHIRPSSTIIIRDMLRRPIAELAIPTSNVFPYTMREFETMWKQVWGLGRYTAEVRTTYGSKAVMTGATVAFWIIPLRLIVLIVVIILIIIGGGIIWKRRQARHDIQEEEQIHILEDRIRQLEEEQGKVE